MRINLLPPEIRERQRARRRTMAVVLVGIILLGALGAFYFLQVMRLGRAERDLAAQQQENARLQAEIAQLQRFDELVRELEATRELLDGLLADRVLWSGVLRDVSLVIPGRAWLTGLTGTIGDVAVTAPEAPEAPVEGGALVGQVSFNGFAFEHPDVALWLSRLEDVRGFVNPWLSTSTKTVIGPTEVVQFTSSVDLSEQALERRGQP